MRTRIVPKTELRSRIKDELAGLGDDTLVVTDRGRPVAVAVSVDRWNSLQETLEDLEDSVAVLEHRLSPGPARPLESVLAEIEAGKPRVRRQARKKS
jgi:prevent-host-death family protein